MKKLNYIVKKIQRKFPLSKAEKWDKVGIQYGNKDQVVNKVLVALDLTTSVFEEALEKKVQLIIVHHPFLWEETIEDNFQNAPYKKSLHTRLLNTGISVYSLHTNYDQSENGTASKIAEKLGYKEYFTPKNVNYSAVINSQSTIREIKSKFKENFGFTKFINGTSSETRKYKTFALLPGSGGIKDIIELNKGVGIDLIITSDIKWSDWITIKELNIDVLEISHEVENVFSDDITNIINNEFKDVQAYSAKLNIKKL